MGKVWHAREPADVARCTLPPRRLLWDSFSSLFLSQRSRLTQWFSDVLLLTPPQGYVRGWQSWWCMHIMSSLSLSLSLSLSPSPSLSLFLSRHSYKPVFKLKGQFYMLCLCGWVCALHASVIVTLWVFFSVSGPLRSCWYLASALVPSSSHVGPLARVSTLSVCLSTGSVLCLVVCLSVPRVSPLSIHQSEPWVFCWWSVCVCVCVCCLLPSWCWSPMEPLARVSILSVCLSTGSVPCLSVCQLWAFCWWSVYVCVLLVAFLMLISYGAFGQVQ